MSEGDHVRRLDDFHVVAIRGKGVFIADEDGSCWHVGGPDSGAGADNDLVAAYREAFPSDD